MPAMSEGASIADIRAQIQDGMDHETIVANTLNESSYEGLLAAGATDDAADKLIDAAEYDKKAAAAGDEKTADQFRAIAAAFRAEAATRLSTAKEAISTFIASTLSSEKAAEQARGSFRGALDYESTGRPLLERTEAQPENINSVAASAEEGRLVLVKQGIGAEPGELRIVAGLFETSAEKNRTELAPLAAAVALEASVYLAAL